MVANGFPEMVIPIGFSILKTKYSACCSIKASSTIGIVIVCVNVLEPVKFKV